MHTTLTLDSLDTVTAVDLKNAAHTALGLGWTVDHYLHPSGVPGCLMVETLVVDDRAGQVTNGDAVWGDWDAATRTIRLDERGPQGEVLVAGLDGQEKPAFLPDVVASVYDLPAVHVNIAGGLRLDFIDVYTDKGVTTVPIDPPSNLSDFDLMVQSLAALKDYPTTRATVRALDAEWERRGPERFTAAKDEVSAWRAATVEGESPKCTVCGVCQPVAAYGGWCCADALKADAALGSDSQVQR